MKNVSYSRRLREDALELGENGILTIRLVVDLIAATNPIDESRIGQLPAVRVGLPLFLFRRAVRFRVDRTARRHGRKEGRGSTFGFR